MHVVATAGHVDHGKSTLVRGLTGQDPDRLAEEARRGLSIELGYCWSELPGVGEVAFVDVPGHERFIGTTLAGLGALRVAMLVVAADDPWMPQAAEHLAALDALDVRHGLLVVTRSDLADPAPALARARAEVGRTTLRDVPDVVVSGRTGEGMDRLRDTLAEVLRAAPGPTGSDVRLWVDRCFTVRGAGVVVTGTLASGTVRPGDVLETDEGEVRVRGVEALGRSRAQVSAPARVALALGSGAPRLRRGTQVVTPGALVRADVVDVRVRPGERPPERPLLHVGSDHLEVRARPLRPGLLRLRLSRALPLRVGDRGVLRDPGSRRLWALEVLDPAPPPLQGRGAARQRAAELEGHDGTLAGEVSRRGLVTRELLRRLGTPGDPPPGALLAGEHVLSGHRAEELRAALEQAVRGSGPAGLAPAAAARAVGVEDAEVALALVRAPLSLAAGRIVLEDAAVALEEHERDALAAVRADLEGRPFAAPTLERLRELGLEGPRLDALVRAGHLERAGRGVVLLPGATAEAVRRLAALAQPFTAGEARAALDTSRRVALPLLAHLDAAGLTSRLPDDRRRVRPSRPG
ncbi:SelB C-terminal domain-containing protein [Phycicoccus endophyticus]|uniref:SelB C-terminal domain-containing protein n=1 Tax=Phycicoccus endophyticus TaxID=1690220 RepID=A0A7G9QZY3_9MICO|nr:SelB C-terminal domain-containing protein [Phycicoccus endophyticus]NHI20762.1 selenocysteine-specific elongation factor [Phycicoccus endophyticus]QNN48908.1 SelB C-terminal domain-containing protein [Phycicoccus endophyticus]GGL43737.1 translation elongation factor [Phycicoccus endophyticus]